MNTFLNKLRSFYLSKGLLSENDRAADRIFYISLFILAFCWICLPVITLDTAYIDISENIVWGKNFQFGYDKNPYIGPWFTRFFYDLTHTIEINYFFSQLFIVCAVWGVWALTKKIFGSVYALICSVSLYILTPFCVKACEFNDDVIQTGFWMLMLVCFHTALKEQKIISWLCTGLFAGLAFMTKYFGVIIFLPMFALMLATEEGRKSFKKPGVYLAGIVFILISLPNIIWLFENNFIAVRYAFARSGLNNEQTGYHFASLQDHIINPLKFYEKYLMNFLGIFALIFFAAPFCEKRKDMNPFDKKYILFLFLGPIILLTVFTVVSGGEIKTSWLLPCYLLAGVFCFVWLKPVPLTKRGIKIFLILVFSFSWIHFVRFFFSEGYYRQFEKRTCGYTAYPAKELSQKLTEEWHQTYHSKLSYVIADRRQGCNIALYSADQPEAYFSANPEFSQWIDENDILKKGALIIWDADEAVPSWFEKYADKNITEIKTIEVPRAARPWLKTLWNKKPLPHRSCYVFLNPQ